MARRDLKRRNVDPVEEAGSESFPASDPPSWSPLTIGAGSERGAAPTAERAAPRRDERR
jgi:hypothetical protein